ncbi:MAG: hypothetical protein ACRYG8_23455 [Janthinobacterium lividum]
MPKAIATPTTLGAIAPASTRRRVLGGAALAALTGGAFGAAIVLPNPGEALSASASPDAGVLAACNAFIAAREHVERLERADAAEDVFDAAVGIMHAALVRVSGLQATTPAGLRAKAGVCRDVLAMDEPRSGEGRFDGPARRHDVLAASFLADFLGTPRPLAPAPVVVSPDAELIRLCVECDGLQARMDALYAVPRPDNLSNAQHIALEKARDLVEKPLADAQDPLLERICELRATTPQGQAARARTLLGWDKDPCWTDDGCWNSQLLGAIVRDLVAAA